MENTAVSTSRVTWVEARATIARRERDAPQSGMSPCSWHLPSRRPLRCLVNGRWSFAATYGFMVTIVLAANLRADGVQRAIDPRGGAG